MWDEEPKQGSKGMPLWELLMLICVIVNCIVLAIQVSQDVSALICWQRALGLAVHILQYVYDHAICQDEVGMEGSLEVVNNAFTCCFVMDMLIKLLAFGYYGYIKVLPL